MARYMKKWHFNYDFNWVNKDGFNIVARLDAFINTIHECLCPENMPNYIEPFHIKISRDELGFHGEAIADWLGTEYVILSKMEVISITHPDRKIFNYNDVEGFNSDICWKKINIFPELEADISIDNIRSTEYLILSDGWTKILSESIGKEIQEMYDSCKNIQSSINCLSYGDSIKSKSEESRKILEEVLKNKCFELISKVFSNRENNYSIPEDPKNYVNSVWRYISIYY